MFIAIGSQAVWQIVLKHEHADFTRKADVRIGLLREVVERLGKGEDVDVERILGTGNEKEEKAWEQGKDQAPVRFFGSVFWLGSRRV
jgi:hypothetical protein